MRKARVITATEEYRRTRRLSLFLAGGITGCPNWQKSLIEGLVGDLDIDLINPRRDNWDMNAGPEESVRQIQWEFKQMNSAVGISFWFPCETDCPIALYELGRVLGNGRRFIFIGTHPGYRRRLDVETQVKLVRPDQKIVFSLPDLETEIIQWVSRMSLF